MNKLRGMPKYKTSQIEFNPKIMASPIVIYLTIKEIKH